MLFLGLTFVFELVSVFVVEVNYGRSSDILVFVIEISEQLSLILCHFSVFEFVFVFVFVFVFEIAFVFVFIFEIVFVFVSVFEIVFVCPSDCL